MLFPKKGGKRDRIVWDFFAKEASEWIELTELLHSYTNTRWQRPIGWHPMGLRLLAAASRASRNFICFIFFRLAAAASQFPNFSPELHLFVVCTFNTFQCFPKFWLAAAASRAKADLQRYGTFTRRRLVDLRPPQVENLGKLEKIPEVWSWPCGARQLSPPRARALLPRARLIIERALVSKGCFAKNTCQALCRTRLSQTSLVV